MTALPSIGTRCLITDPESADPDRTIRGTVVGYGTLLRNPTVERALGTEFHAQEYPAPVVLVHVSLAHTSQAICVHPDNMVVAP